MAHQISHCKKPNDARISTLACHSNNTHKRVLEHKLVHLVAGVPRLIVCEICLDLLLENVVDQGADDLWREGAPGMLSLTHCSSPESRSHKKSLLCCALYAECS